MSYTKEDKKAVFDFWVNILEQFNCPVYYDHIRGYVTQAPQIVKSYVIQKCKGEQFLEYFRRRKNYFIVEKYFVSLKNKKFRTPVEDDYFSEDESAVLNTEKENKPKVQEKSRSRQNSESSITPPNHEKCDHPSKDDEEREKYEDIAIKYFTEYLKRNKKIQVNLIDVSTLNKKIQRLINKHYGRKPRSFFLSFPAYFFIDDENYVLIRFPDKEAPTQKEDLKTDNKIKPDKTNSENIPVELKNAMNYCASLQFFVDILHQKPSSFPIDKLSGYLSQAAKEIRDYIKYNYRTFSDFFIGAPAIFQVNKYCEVTLSSECNKLLKHMKKFLNKAMINSLGSSDVPLKSRIDCLLKRKVQLDISETPNNSKSVNSIESEDVCLQSTTQKETLIELKHLQREVGEIPTALKKQSLTEVKELEELSDQNKAMGKFDKIENIVTFEDQEGKFLEFLFCVELYCVSIVESEHWFLDQSEIKTVRYFTDILEKCKISEVTSLRGHLGNASDEVRSFINRYYKNEKFKDLFSKHDQLFTLKSNVITLAPKYKKFIVEEESEINTLEDDRCDVKIIESIYEDSYFKELKTELFAYLYEVAHYLRFKDKTKLSRITEIRLRFSHCNEWIKLMEGESLVKKTSNFLSIFHIFEFPSDDYILFCCNNHSNLLVSWLEEMSNSYQIQRISSTPYYLFIQKFNEVKPYSDYEETSMKLSQESIYMMNQLVKDHLKNQPFIEYHALPLLLPKNLLKEINECKRDSSAILLNLLKKDLILKKGNIKLNYTDANIDLMTENIVNKKYSDNSNAESIDKFETLTVQNMNDVDATNLKEHISSVNQNLTITNENSICFSNELIDLLNKYKESDNLSANDSQSKKMDLQNDVSEKKVNVNIKHKVDVNPSLEKELTLQYNTLTENNSSETDLHDGDKNQAFTSQNTLQPNFNSETTTKSNCCTDIAQGSRQKSDSGFEESDFIYSEKIDIHPCDIRSSSSSSSFEDNADTTLNLSANSKENSTKHAISALKTAQKEIPSLQISFSSPGHIQSKNLSLETDSDSDSCIADCKNINMCLKECIETSEYSESDFYTKQEVFLNDCNLAELLSHDDYTYLNAFSEASASNLECYSNENMNKSSKLQLENDGKESISPRISNTKTVNESSLKQTFAAKQTEKYEESFMKICEKDAPFYSDDKSKTKKSPFTEKIPLNNNINAAVNEIPLGDNNCNESKEPTNSMQSCINYPLQPLIAEIVLLTTNSCIAVTNIDSRLQSIYIVKSVFFCDKHEYCSTCFDLLTIGDKISCFVPLTEISQKMWIALMVSKEKPPDPDRMKCVNELLSKQICVDNCLKSLAVKNKVTEPLDKSIGNISSNKNFKSYSCDWVNSKTISTESEMQTQTEQWCLKCKSKYSTFSFQRQDSKQVINSFKEMENPTFLNSHCNCNKEKIDANCAALPDVQHCSTQIDYSYTDIECQTLLSGQVKECANTGEVASQTFSNFISSQHVSVQTELQMTHCGSQTVQNSVSKEAQTDSIEVKKIETCCQTELSGEVKSVMKIVNMDAQTISTGNIMITDYYHL